jgi:superfamily II DNA helicase RecQ
MPLSDEELNGLILGVVETLKPGLTLKTFQNDCLHSIAKNHMTITSAKTGSGKSIVFIASAKMLQILSSRGESLGVVPAGSSAAMSKRKAILLMLPYLSLVDGTKSEIQCSYPAIKVAHIDTETSAADVYEEALKGDLDVIITTPEMYCKKGVSELFSADSIQGSRVISGVFFDECHNIVTSSDFRAMYLICVKQNFKFTKVIFLSGSLPLNVLRSLRGALFHIPDCERSFRDIITTPQSRDEIYLHFQTVTSNQNFKHLHFILGLMHNWRDLSDVSSFPQFLIYVDSLANLRDLFDWFHIVTG